MPYTTETEFVELTPQITAQIEIDSGFEVEEMQGKNVKIRNSEVTVLNVFVDDLDITPTGNKAADAANLKNLFNALAKQAVR